MAAGKVFSISFALNAALGGSFSATMSSGQAAMRRLKDETGRIKTEQRQLDAAWRTSQAAVAAYRAKISSLTAQYQAGKISESQFRNSVSIAAQTMKSASMSITEYRTNLQRLQGELQKTQTAMQQMNAARAAKASATARFDNAKAGMSSTFSAVGTAASPLIGAIQTAAGFEAAMSKVKAITRASSSEMQALTDNARMLGETTQFSATQAADAMSYLGMAGWNTSQIMAGMPGLLALAAAGGTDLARTADIISDDLTAFGLSADQAGHMADVFAVTVTRTNTNVEMLGETMKYAAPVAKAFGASMEETAALAGLMANSGIKASQAGTALRAGFLRLAGPPKQASKAMAELGLSMSDVTAQQQETKAALESLGISMSDSNGPRKMSAILSELKTKTAGLGQEEKLATLKMIFGTEAATGWLAVLDAGPETFNNLVDQMENCDGEAQKMAQVMMDNTKGAFIQLKSAMEGLAISVGNVFLPTITKGLKMFSAFAAAASSWVKSHESIVAVIGSIGTAAASLITGQRIITLMSAAFSYLKINLISLISPLGSAVSYAGTLVKGFSFAGKLQTAATAFRGLGTAIASIGRVSMTAIFSPAGIALAAIAAAAYLIYSNWETVGPFLTAMWEEVAAAISNAWAMVAPALADLQNALSGLWAALAPQLMALGDTVMTAFSAISAAITANSGAFDTLFNIIGMVAQILGGALIGAFMLFAEIIVTNVTMAINIAAAVITGFIGVVSGIVEMIAGILAGDWSAAWDGAANAVSAAFNAMYGVVAGIGNAIMGTIQNIISAAKSAASAVLNLGSGGGGEAVAVDSNASGGIYAKGAFLTTFAEEGPEAAIPLDGSPRAIGLWQKAGEILGVGENTAKNDSAPRIAPKVFSTANEPAGQIKMPPINITMNLYGQDDPQQVRQAVLDAGAQVQQSFAEQMEKYQRERGRLSFG